MCAIYRIMINQALNESQLITFHIFLYTFRIPIYVDIPLAREITQIPRKLNISMKIDPGEILE